jgi:amino acid adenylation domain-containing protein
VSVTLLLTELRARGIELELTNGKLVSRAPRGALTPDLAALVRERREEISAFLREAQSERDSADIPPIRPVPRAEFMPVSYSQERLWYLNQVDENPAVYNLPLSFRVVGPLRPDVLQRCLDTIEERHEALRTTIAMVDGRAMQRIHAPRGLPLRHVDLRPDHATADAAPLQAVLQQEAMGAFDLTRGPLARATLIRSAEEEHYFLLVMHHVISDGLSTQIILRELVTLYDAFGRGEPSPLPSLAVQFADYAVWQRGWLQGAALDQQLQYWQQRLSAPLPVLDLPTDHPRPAMRSANGSKEPLRLGKDLVAALNRIGREEGATTFMVLLAVYKVLLHRYASQDDVIVGAPVANRTRHESADIVGFVANTVVLRTSLEGDPPFRELVRRVRDTCVGAFRHQDMPFQKIVEVLNPPRDMSRTPIFQAFFTFHEISSQAARLGDLELHPVVAGSNVSRMDLSLFLRELDTEILGSLEYNTDLFTAATIRRMIGHFATLAESAASAPSAAVSRLTMLTDADRLALAAWNETETDFPRVPLHEMVGTQLLVGGDRIAVRSGDVTLTYADLDGRANRLAHQLRALGAGRGDLVGVCLERSADLPVAMLAALKCGAAYVPLDPEFPPARLAYMMDDAGVRVIVSHRGVADRVPVGDRKVVWLDDLERAPLLDQAPPSDGDSHDRAYVIYTSGSTGLPKGVEVLGDNVANFLSAMRERPGIRPDDVLVAVTTPSFDIAVLELFLPLTVGATVVVAPKETVMDGARLAALLRDSDATMMQATPATWRALLDAGWRGQPGLKALCGGETLPPDLARRLLPLVGELWNMYGPTETTVWSTCARITDAAAPITIGTPIGNTVIRVVDRAGQQVPVGVPGELFIGGAGVARGYLGRSELNAQRFVADPTGQEPAMRFYRTGDLVRLLPSGHLEHSGRLDDQVKVQGFRIELGEIEAVLGALPAIAEAVVSVHADPSGDSRLIAWVVYRPGEQPTVSEVRRYLRHQLPPYMVPGMIVQLDAVPRTANGKVNRRALPNPLGSASANRRFVEPATPMERLLATTWSSLLPVKKVGRDDNFFELGGHSLLSMRAVATIEQQTGVRLDPRLFFFQTVQQIAATLDRRTAPVES